jgi:hypothetical protein
VTVGKGQEESSFFEKKEAKKLCPFWPSQSNIPAKTSDFFTPVKFRF